MVGDEDVGAANREFLEIARRYVAGEILYVDAYSIRPRSTGRSMGAGAGVVVGMVLVALGELTRPWRVRRNGRSPEELLVVTSQEVAELHLQWRAGRGWTSEGMVRVWDRAKLRCSTWGEDYGLSLREQGSDDHVVLAPIDLTAVSIRLARQIVNR